MPQISSSDAEGCSDRNWHQRKLWHKLTNALLSYNMHVIMRDIDHGIRTIEEMQKLRHKPTSITFMPIVHGFARVWRNARDVRFKSFTYYGSIWVCFSDLGYCYSSGSGSSINGYIDAGGAALCSHCGGICNIAHKRSQMTEL
ncbi:hypothetical protein L1987_60488 [Smallanthus sonchifolius]|uniref:Uncharacterized protein n=1 Tax=Smallanthus sonchifolius TaxID=185202 RepID=A0ACB9D881_9ASTR|nr:hypothetical protein L1987_60488 [Smallanthus sonchifolius]